MSRPTPAALPAQSRRTRRATEGAGQSRSVALVTLGCARNEVDSEELAGRLADGGWTLVEDPRAADVAVVNTCGFIESAKKDSIDALLEAAEYKQSGHTKAVVAVGCLAQRYGEQLAAELPEADAVLGFDSYASMSAQLAAILDGERRPSHTPSDRRGMLPLSPASRPGSPGAVPGHGTGQHPDEATRYPASGPRFIRARLADRPWAPLKIASGCDRRCAFCAIPMFRGAFVSRRPAEVVEEAYWLAERGVRELFLVSENSTSYGKDLGDLRLLERLLPELATVPGIERVRVSYLQPAELRPGLLEVIAGTPGVAPYFDLSFQHASAPLLRRMRRFGGREPFLELLSRVRASAPHAGVRSNLILGFPGETQADVDELETFLVEARLDAVGVFGYSDEDGTEAEGYPDKIEQDVVADRVAYIGDLVEQLTSQRAQQRVGEPVQVLVEEIEDGQVVGRAAHQGPDVDGVTLLRMPSGVSPPDVGRIVPAVVLDHDGVDLVAQPR